MEEKNKESINCLKNEKVIVRRISKQTGLVTDPKSPLYGGMSETAVKTFMVPRLSSGNLVNVLTDNEKAFLEEAMGLPYNALSIYKKENNFWTSFENKGCNQVRLTKHDVYLDLSDPEQYIKYKILLANKDFIAPSLKVLEDTPKASYQFVIIGSDDENKMAKQNLNATMASYKEFGKIEDDVDTMRLIIEIIDGRPLSHNTKKEFLQTKIDELIKSNSKLFLNVIKDELLPTKVLIKKCIENGTIVKRGDSFYLREDNMPMCGNNENPTLNNAAIWLNKPKNQEIKLILEAKLVQQ